MTRVKNSVTTRARHKKVLKAAKGYFGSKHRLYKTAKEQLMHSGQYAFRDRRQKKRDFRKLWITRINAACRENEISYSSKAGIEVNRKMLSEIAICDSKAFSELVKQAKLGLDGKIISSKKEIKNEVEVIKVEETKENKTKEKKSSTKTTKKKETISNEIKEVEDNKEKVEKKKTTTRKTTKKEEK